MTDPARRRAAVIMCRICTEPAPPRVICSRRWGMSLTLSRGCLRICASIARGRLSFIRSRMKKWRLPRLIWLRKGGSRRIDDADFAAAHLRAQVPHCSKPVFKLVQKNHAKKAAVRCCIAALEYQKNDWPPALASSRCSGSRVKRCGFAATIPSGGADFCRFFDKQGASISVRASFSAFSSYYKAAVRCCIAAFRA